MVKDREGDPMWQDEVLPGLAEVLGTTVGDAVAYLERAARLPT